LKYGFRDRLKELRAKKRLTPEEMSERIKLSDPGSFKLGPNLFDLGVVDLDKFEVNFKKGYEQIEYAIKQGFYLEAISLRLQFIDFWLRAFRVMKNGKGKIFGTNDKLQFGQLISECEN